MNGSLYPHQRDAITKLNNGKVLVGGVGSGKSRTALAYYWQYECQRMKRMKPLYIITTARKRDSLEWEGEAVYFGLSKDPSLTVAPFVVDSWNNLHKYIYVRDAFFIFDEQRVVGYGAWVKAFLQVTRRNRWILLSATPGDTWMDYLPLFIANGFFRNKREFECKHVVYNRYSKFRKVERYTDEEQLKEYRDRIVVEMPFERYTRHHVEMVECEYDHASFMRIFRGRWNVFTNSPILQAGEWCYTMRHSVNMDPSRLFHLIELIERHNKVIVFYNFDYELSLIYDGLVEYYIDNAHGVKPITITAYNGHQHDMLPEGDRWVYLVQYNAGSEAWNCITTDTIVFYSLNYSYKMMVQAAGRIDRANTPFVDLYYYVLYSKSTIDKSILVALKNKKKFNENHFYTKYANEEKSCVS